MRHSFALRFLSAVVLLLAALLAACAGSAPTPTLIPVFPTSVEATATATAPESVPTLAPSQTPPPATATATAVITATAVNTAAATSTPTLAPSPTPDTVLAQAKLVGLSWLAKYKYNLLVSIDFPGPVDSAAYRVTLEDREYKCEVLAQLPNRLYCNGQGAKVLAKATVRVYSAGSSQPGFEQDVMVPFFDNNYSIED